MCAKDDLIGRKGLLLTSTQTWKVLFQIHDRQLAGELATAESVTAKDSNYVDIFGLDFAFSFAAWLQQIKCTLGDINSLFADNILSLIAFIISYRLFADELNIQQSLLDRAIVVLIIISVNKIQLLLILGDRLTPSTLLAEFIPTTKIRDPLLKTDYEEQVLLTSVKKNCYCTRCTKYYNFNIYVSLATDTLHLLLKGLVMKMLDFMQDMLDDIYPSSRKTWDNSTILVTQESSTVVSLLFVSKAPFALHFICAVCDLVTLAQYKRALERMNIFKEEFRVYRRTLGEEKNFNYPKYICTRANSEAHYITIVKQFYSMTNKKDKRHNDPEHCDEEVRRDYVWVQEFKHRDNRRQSRTVTDNGKHIAYIGAFSEVLLFNNNGQINNTTRILSVPFKFYDLSTIICLVHLVPRDLPDLITRTTMSYYVNNYIN
ncbi:hypothetical protein HBH75_101690 [Parastagonospora nodorum]|nr:hypothetical protein HBH75_101690 [Parastagonospora nodorum]